MLLGAAIAYLILQRPSSPSTATTRVLATAIGKDIKGQISPLFYIVAIPLAFVNHYWSNALFVAVALMWVIPDPRIERRLTS